MKREYRSSSLDCTGCPMKAECLGAKTDFKKIEDTVDKPLYDRMHERLQTQKAKRMRKLRSSTLDSVLGTLDNFLGMRRVNTGGIEQANKCMLMAAVAYNLKKLMKWTGKKVRADVKAMQADMHRSFFTFKSLMSFSYFLLRPVCYK